MAPPLPKVSTFSLTGDRIFGRIISPKRPSRLRPACDPPLQAGFVFLGSRLLANQLCHSAPGSARSQFGCGLSGKDAKLVELHTDGAILEHSSDGTVNLGRGLAGKVGTGR